MLKYWMVYVEGRAPPQVVHNTREEAVIEAERLARKQMRLVYLCETVAVCEVKDAPVSWTTLGEEKNTCEWNTRSERTF